MGIESPADDDAARGDEPPAPGDAPRRPFRVRPIQGGFARGIDPDRINHLLYELDVEHFLNVERYGAGDPCFGDEDS